MKQIIQSLRDGSVSLVDVPAPNAVEGNVLIRTKMSLISTGTEKMLIGFGKSNWFERARSQPDKVKMVLEKLKSDGLFSVIEAVNSKLDEPIALGYSNVGIVINGSGTDIKEGARVISNGPHSEVVRVNKNLVTEVPDNVTDEEAAFTVVGSIALQGIRLISPSIGELVVVQGLGLIGLLAVQILVANGCRVYGVDISKDRCKLGNAFGARCFSPDDFETLKSEINKASSNNGVDAVLITASSQSDKIVSDSASITRKKGKIVLVGVVGLNLRRDDFYKKEISFQVSCSYGPGRYDSKYENEGIDYPYGYVRWTEKRNFEAVLQLMSQKKIDVKPLLSRIFDIKEALSAYEHLQSKECMSVALKYDTGKIDYSTPQLITNQKISLSLGSINLAFIGAGNYSSRVLIPNFKSTRRVNLHTIVSSGGTSSGIIGKKNGFKFISSDEHDALSEEVDAVIIATRHNDHSRQIISSLKHNKHVFVEKPLALNLTEIDAIEKAYNNSKQILTVGYNRRFSPFAKKVKSAIDKYSEPKNIIMTMNAGFIPSEHWTQNEKVGGGRIVGEACHYIDLMRFFVGSKITNYHASKLGKNDFHETVDDKCIITLEFADGSVGSIHYLSNGGKSFPKERIEIFCNNSVLQIDNFLKLRSFGFKGISNISNFKQNKGQKECILEFINGIKEGYEPISSEELFEVARFSVKIAQSLR